MKKPLSLCGGGKSIKHPGLKGAGSLEKKGKKDNGAPSYRLHPYKKAKWCKLGTKTRTGEKPGTLTVSGASTSLYVICAKCIQAISTQDCANFELMCISTPKQERKQARKKLKTRLVLTLLADGYHLSVWVTVRVVIPGKFQDWILFFSEN